MICGSVLVRAGGELVANCSRSIFGKEGSINVRFVENFSRSKTSTGYKTKLIARLVLRRGRRAKFIRQYSPTSIKRPPSGLRKVTA